MRRGSDSSFIFLDSNSFSSRKFSNTEGIFVGVNFGSDFATEHECGIKPLRRSLGIPEFSRESLGIENRRIKLVNPGVNYFYVERNKRTMLAFNPHVHNEESAKHIMNFDIDTDKACFHELQLMRDQDLCCCWDDTSFGILTNNKNQQWMKLLNNAILSQDAMILLGFKDTWISNPGLVISIISKLPSEITDQLRDADLDHFKLMDRVDEIGILKRLEDTKKGKFNTCGFMACSPRWITGQGSRMQTKYDVMFWLNPMEQQLNNAMWCTVEDLDLWIEGKGPIIKTKKEQDEHKKVFGF